MRLIFKIRISVYQSKANLYMNILFRKITYLSDPEIRKNAAGGMYRKRIPRFNLVHVLLPSGIKTTNNNC